jgi:hypothetical protein
MATTAMPFGATAAGEVGARFGAAIGAAVALEAAAVGAAEGVAVADDAGKGGSGAATGSA